MSFNFGNTSAIGTSTPAKRKYRENEYLPPNRYFWLCLNNVLIFCHRTAAFGNFSFNTPAATTAPPAFGTPAPTQSTGFGQTPGFGQASFGAPS